jgi:hypothetical protein
MIYPNLAIVIIIHKYKRKGNNYTEKGRFYLFVLRKDGKITRFAGLVLVSLER